MLALLVPCKQQSSCPNV